MPEILTESFCERCGTKYTLDTPEEKGRKGGGKRARVLARGLKNFVLSDDPLQDAFAAAEIEEGSAAASQQLEAFHELFNFCMECRQYTCANCWNQDEGRCLSCAPVVGRYDPLLNLTQDSTLPSLSVGLGMEPSPLQAAIDGREANGHTPVDAAAWPTADLPPAPEPLIDAEIPDWLRPSAEEQVPQAAIEAGPVEQPLAPEAVTPEPIAPEPIAEEVFEPYVPEAAEAYAPEAVQAYAEPVEAIAPEAVETFTPEAVEAYAHEAAEAYAPEAAEAYAPEAVDAYAPESAEAYAPESAEAYTPEVVETYEPEAVEAYVPEAVETFTPEAVQSYAPEPVAAEPEPLARPASLEPFDLLGVDATGVEPAAAEWPEPQGAFAAEVEVEEPEAQPAVEPTAAPEPHAGIFDRIMDRFGLQHPTAAEAPVFEGQEPAPAFETAPEEVQPEWTDAITAPEEVQPDWAEVATGQESPLEAAMRAHQERAAAEAPEFAQPEPVAMEPIEAELVVDEDAPLALEPEPLQLEREPLQLEPEPFQPEPLQPDAIEAEPVAPGPAPEAAPWPMATEEAVEAEPVWPPRAPIYQPPPPVPAPSQPPAAPMAPIVPPAAPFVPPAMAAQQVQQARAAHPIEPPTASLVWEESARGVVSRAGTSVQGCVSCGLALSASARFCRRCGTRQG